ncbi:thiosulfate/3-mercaptopyruvate sulfurtransferase [Devosia enhydra]|uniref:Thiosulfate/3-mercaptopyruvate sulfurtransferase n=1 Tax=Devosia enhydra TaxID=665118 RepID=A0A1K2I2E8_9HYPH|nr:rhodanese-like domain-containing protein [Devosia enhydra]SFZ86415.1 thiosulfate/3-mercaptopyruvate sulfurtransferase [Devosia enhydra]
MKLKTLAVFAALASSLTLSTAALALPAILQQSEGLGAYISLDQLKGLGDDVVLVDIRTADRYAAGHIPGAINIPREFIETPDVNGVIGETKSYEELEPILAGYGLSYDQTIVVYGEFDANPLSPDSARFPGKIYVSLDQAGFPNVHILSGGFDVWDGYVTTEATVLPPSDLKLTDTKPYIVQKDYVLAALEGGEAFVLDARGTAGYDRGHIPGSLNVPIGLFSDANTLKEDIDGLVARLAELGIEKDDEIITTCGWGWAASDLLAILKDLGYSNLKLYDGSWTEWVQDPNLPKAGTDFAA